MDARRRVNEDAINRRSGAPHMPAPSPHPADGAAPAQGHAVERADPLTAPVTPERRLEAASLLVGRNRPDSLDAGRRFLEGSRRHGIDIGNFWVSLDAAGAYTQACLAVAAPGRTAMIFCSTPARESDVAALSGAARSACARAVARVDAPHTPSRLAQALLEPGETAVAQALVAAGFVRLAELSYLRLELARWKRRRTRDPGPESDAGPWPEGVTIQNVPHGAPTAEHTREMLAALRRSYIDTLDCPELCALREPEDVLESHRATGRFDPRLWWLVRQGGKPEGAMLFNVCPGQGHAELVYLGLGPGLRGKGLGARLMRLGLDNVAAMSPEPAVTCAVDNRNAPARRLYGQLGFEPFAQRLALVKRL